VKQLRASRVAKWTVLAEQADCSTKTVQRALSKAGYFSSMNYNGTFVTLQGTPRFDRLGLWEFQSVHFSQHGNLPQTVRRIIELAPAGCTVQELEELVGTRIHNHVSRLLREGKLDRFFHGRQVVYLAADPRRREAQQERRRQGETPQASAVQRMALPAGLDAVTVIQVLVRLLEAPGDSVASVARTLQARKLAVRADQVRQILDFYGLKKTTR
jgi:DNA-binding transcriptional regulator YhcF (GntR family)